MFLGYLLHGFCCIRIFEFESLSNSKQSRTSHARFVATFYERISLNRWISVSTVLSGRGDKKGLCEAGEREKKDDGNVEMNSFNFKVLWIFFIYRFVDLKRWHLFLLFDEVVYRRIRGGGLRMLSEIWCKSCYFLKPPVPQKGWLSIGWLMIQVVHPENTCLNLSGFEPVASRRQSEHPTFVLSSVTLICSGFETM